MDVGGVGLEEEEDVAWRVERDVAEGDVPVVGDGVGGGEAVAGEGVESCDERSGVCERLGCHGIDVVMGTIGLVLKVVMANQFGQCKVLDTMAEWQSMTSAFTYI